MPGDALLPLSSHALRLQRKWDLTPHTALHTARVLRRHPGLYVTSGRRTPEKNAAVGGVTGSFHLRGRGVDFGGPLQALVNARAWVRDDRATLTCTGPEEVLLEAPGTRRQHLHVAW